MLLEITSLCGTLIQAFQQRRYLVFSKKYTFSDKFKAVSKLFLFPPLFIPIPGGGNVIDTGVLGVPPVQLTVQQ